jgi:hypothetical protein
MQVLVMKNRYMSLIPENVIVVQIVSKNLEFYGTKNPVAVPPASIPRCGPKGTVTHPCKTHRYLTLERQYGKLITNSALWGCGWLHILLIFTVTIP